MEKKIRDKYQRITNKLIENNITITTMESCTCGLIASLLTDTEGASAVFKGASVTYCNEAKIQAGVPEPVIREFGVYSRETAEAMAKAAKDTFRADISIGVTGSFGNTDPNNADSVPGEVWVCIICDENNNEVKYGLHIHIPQQKDRPAYKQYVADAVADRLLELSLINEACNG